MSQRIVHMTAGLDLIDLCGDLADVALEVNGLPPEQLAEVTTRLQQYARQRDALFCHVLHDERIIAYTIGFTADPTSPWFQIFDLPADHLKGSFVIAELGVVEEFRDQDFGGLLAHFMINGVAVDRGYPSVVATIADHNTACQKIRTALLLEPVAGPNTSADGHTYRLYRRDL